MSTTSPTPPSPQGTISGSTFKWNRAADDGSALAIADAYPTLNQVGVVENIAGGNAAIALFGASLQMLNTTVARNTAGSGTGGLNVGGASGDEVLIVHSSLVENDPLGLRTTGAPDVELRSSIVAENQAGNCSAITTPITSGNYNDNFEAADLSQWSGMPASPPAHRTGSRCRPRRSAPAPPRTIALPVPARPPECPAD